ncbi:MAG: NADH-quinone oxidoreductase subunit J [Solirubrobacteraceae bacterium]|nr:NADH-quinone oxidoreductase subunit J [Solirubrobacteraceae bacterium]
MAELLFFIVGPLAVIAAVGTVALRNPFFAVLSLVVHLLALAMLFMLLQAQFVAVVQVLVYVGAVMVLYLFVTAYVGGDADPRGGSGPSLRWLSYAIGASLVVLLAITFIGSGLQAIDTRGAPYDPELGSPGQIGELLLSRYLVVFEGSALLLLVATVGAVVLARRRRGVLPGEDRTISALDLFAPTGTGSMREGVGAINPVPGAIRARITPQTGAASPPSAEFDDGDDDGTEDRR